MVNIDGKSYPCKCAPGKPCLFHYNQANPSVDFIEGEHGHAHREGSATGAKGEFWHVCMKNGTEWYAFEARDVHALLDHDTANGFVYTLDQWRALPYGHQLRS